MEPPKKKKVVYDLFQPLDIPSSNFAGSLGKKSSKYAESFDVLKSVPISGPNHKDPTKILQALPMDQKYKELLGPDQTELAKLAAQKAKEAKEAAKIALTKPAKEEEQKKMDEEIMAAKALPTQIFQDEQGRIRDKEGKLLNIMGTQTSSLDINRAKFRENKIKQLLKIQKEAEEEQLKQSKFFDTTLKAGPKKKVVGVFQFITKGSIVDKASEIREDTQLRKRAPEIGSADQEDYKQLSRKLKRTGVKRVAARQTHFNPVNPIDPWDLALIPQGQPLYIPLSHLKDLPSEYSLKDLNSLDREKVWDSIAFHDFALSKLKTLHPDSSFLNPKFSEPVPPMDQSAINEMFKPKIVQPVLQTRLTKEEKKKAAKEKRREFMKEMQEKIKYGLMEAPPPKVKLTNFMRTLANQAVQDPTAVEQEVRKIVAENQKKHKERNEARKLTKEQKQEKLMKKLKKDSAKECRVCVFLVKVSSGLIQSLHDFKIRAKVDKNAQDLALNGFCFVPAKDVSHILPVAIIVEAGPKYLKFFKRLLLHRIDWTARRGRKTNTSMEDNTEGVEENKHCRLVWEGTINDHIFPKWSIIEIRNEFEARKLLADRGVEEYWDMTLAKFKAE